MDDMVKSTHIRDGSLFCSLAIREIKNKSEALAISFQSHSCLADGNADKHERHISKENIFFKNTNSL